MRGTSELGGTIIGDARWEKRTSWRAQGWAGEKVRALGDETNPAPKDNKQAWKKGTDLRFFCRSRSIVFWLDGSPCKV